MTGAETNQPVLRLNNITKRFGALTANDAITFSLNKGEVIALLGENGAGKTTLMNILFGHYTADEGEVEVFGEVLPAGMPRAALEAGVGMVHQHFTLADNMTVLENIVLGTEAMTRFRLNRKKSRERIEQLSQDFGLSVNSNVKVGTLSVGERQRVEILKALYRDARILILDEPTAVLTPSETDALFETLRKAVSIGLSIIFISHKLHEVMAISSRVLVLRHGKLSGEVETKNTNRHQLAEMMVGAEITPPKVQDSNVGSTLLKLDNVSTPDEGNTPGLKNINLSLNAGQIIGLAGVSGNGQSVLADVVGGLLAPDKGVIYLNDVAVENWSPKSAIASGIARIPEDRHKTGTIADFSLTENSILETFDSDKFSRYGWMNWGKAYQFTRHIIDTYDVRCPGPDTRIRLLSGGNMQKLILGRVLEENPKIILANQPVRGLDIGAVTYVHNRLLEARANGASVLLISEDLDEIMSLSDVIYVICEGRLSPGFDRATKTPAELGMWMAGHQMQEEPSHAS